MNKALYALWEFFIVTCCTLFGIALLALSIGTIHWFTILLLPLIGSWAGALSDSMYGWSLTKTLAKAAGQPIWWL